MARTCVVAVAAEVRRVGEDRVDDQRLLAIVVTERDGHPLAAEEAVVGADGAPPVAGDLVRHRAMLADRARRRPGGAGRPSSSTRGPVDAVERHARSGSGRRRGRRGSRTRAGGRVRSTRDRCPGRCRWPARGRTSGRRSPRRRIVAAVVVGPARERPRRRSWLEPPGRRRSGPRSRGAPRRARPARAARRSGRAPPRSPRRGRRTGPGDRTGRRSARRRGAGGRTGCWPTVAVVVAARRSVASRADGRLRRPGRRATVHAAVTSDRRRRVLDCHDLDGSSVWSPTRLNVEPNDRRGG